LKEEDFEKNDALAEALISLAHAKKVSVATAESCTGGMIAASLTSVAGASEVYKGSIVSYANEAKVALLDVSNQTLLTEGAVSEQTALQMARGARKALATDFAVSTTGVAGPGGGTVQKPVGTVWIAVASVREERATPHRFSGTRAQIRLAATEAALQELAALVQETVIYR
jgi:nicotinamide-nucleotide amidase